MIEELFSAKKYSEYVNCSSCVFSVGVMMLIVIVARANVIYPVFWQVEDGALL